MRLEDVKQGPGLVGVVPGESVEVLGLSFAGPDALVVTYQGRDGVLARTVLYRDAEPELSQSADTNRPFDADGSLFRLVAEAQRIRLAGLHDPMSAVSTSDVRPLPHQIRAVYGEMLERRPLRYLLADDPGAGKTIMAGLLIKELLLREDVKRCLIVAPGGLVEQWQDELWFKFGLRFTILTAALAEAEMGSVFTSHPRLIVRMDQVARNEDLLTQLGDCEWDLAIVDEAHRMSARHYGAELKKSKRFELGELLGRRTRHLLLMTATPHSGLEDDFQTFLTLLDEDLFEGRRRPGHTTDASTVMLRRVKEELMTFEGKPLFPERVAQTVPYELTGPEVELYEAVSDYVRDEMNRADTLDGKRRNTVGFALTVLQRRLASSPEAIYQSLQRRAARLEQRRTDLINGVGVRDSAPPEQLLDDSDEYSAADVEDLEEELVDAATAARTAEELETELLVLRRLIGAAARVRQLDTDRKWVELRSILEDQGPDKLIVFTEHRDTLHYLKRRIGSLLGRPDAVVTIHGGVHRAERRQVTEEFTTNPAVRIMLATDAAGEGLNLQAAHLMVNYDLPWNPNRIEQRFGRIHRIGQENVCRLWNLVASNTREGEVFLRLLAKIEEQQRAYGGKVFDVLGSAFEETPLRELLMEAIRYGELPEVRARMHEVIDSTVSEGLHELLQERALAQDSMSATSIIELRREMERARAQRLQPHFIEDAFIASFKRLGGRIIRRESSRYEIKHVPPAVQAAAFGPVSSAYARVTFSLDHIDAEQPRAELLAPGHPLHDAVQSLALQTWGDVLDRGSVLVSTKVEEPSLLVGVVEEVVDGTGESVAKRFGYAYVTASGAVYDAGPAPYLDAVPAPVGAAGIAELSWLAGAEEIACNWIVSHRLPDYLASVSRRRESELTRVRTQVRERLLAEINRLAADAMVAEEKAARGVRVRERGESLDRKRAELEARLEQRLSLLERQQRLGASPPQVTVAAVVLPFGEHVEELPETSPMRAVETEAVERRGVDAVLAAERALGRIPREMAHNNQGYDIESVPADPADPSPLVFIEVKARIEGSGDFFVTRSEVRHGRNSAPNYRLALVKVALAGPQYDEVRYIDDPFAGVSMGNFDNEGIKGNWAKTWAKGSAPH